MRNLQGKDMSTGNVKEFYDTHCFVYASRSCLVLPLFKKGVC